MASNWVTAEIYPNKGDFLGFVEVLKEHGFGIDEHNSLKRACYGTGLVVEGCSLVGESDHVNASAFDGKLLDALQDAANQNMLHSGEMTLEYGNGEQNRYRLVGGVWLVEVSISFMIPYQKEQKWIETTATLKELLKRNISSAVTVIADSQT